MRGIAIVVTGVLVLSSCGGDNLTEGVGAPQEDGQSGGAVDGTSVGGQSPEDGGASTGEAPAAVEPAAMDTIRIGSQVWQRTLPMTSGQCFVFEDDGVLPSSGVAWGPLDGEEGLRFDASLRQDGTMDAGVQLGEEFWWRAGAGSGGPDDLEVVLDFDALTITGQGTFWNIYSQEAAAGSFAFQCEDDGTGTG